MSELALNFESTTAPSIARDEKTCRLCGQTKPFHSFYYRHNRFDARCKVCMKPSPEYRTWLAMKRRCFNENDAGYRNYGGRGIVVCERWKSSFENFFSDMGSKPSSKYSIDRIDNNGIYEPSNCRWATRAQQNENTRHNVFVTMNGKTQTQAAWCRELGIHVATVRTRREVGLSWEESFQAGRLRRRGRNPHD